MFIPIASAHASPVMNALSFRLFGSFLGVSMIVLGLGVLVAACGSKHNAELVVADCTDQDGASLDDAVMITVDGTSKNWKPGETVHFPLQVESDAKTVRVRARAGGNYAYASQPAFTLVPGETKTIDLRFMRPYVITVQALGLSDTPLSDVEIYAENQHVGATDEQGLFTWSFTDAARAGDKIDLVLQKGGETATPAPIILRQSVFAYDAEGRLPLHGTPESMLATTEPLPQDESATPPADSESAAPPVASSHPDVAPTPSPRQERVRTVAERSPPPSGRETIPERETTSEPAGATVSEPTSAPEATPDPPPPAPETPPEPPATSEPTPSPADAPGSAERTLLQRGDLARQRGALRDAIDYYEQVPLSNREAYKKAQHHIGEIYFREMQPRDFQGAIQAFQAVLEADHSEYAAHHNLAAVYLEVDALDEAEEHLNRVLALKHRIPLAQRQRVEREARYRLALIQFARFEGERIPDNKFEQGLLAQSALQRFIDAVPSDNASFAAKRRDAQQRITTIRQWIDQSR